MKHIEFKIQKALVQYMRARGWLVERLIGNAFQYGIPDLYCYHPKWGERWVDCKRPDNTYSFTKAQRQKWPLWAKYGVGIWILTSIDDYPLLFKEPNWRNYWKSTWVYPSEEEIDRLLDDIEG